nr:hypothetical protein F511_12178 [Tanacetum cinerariifolium]
MLSRISFHVLYGRGVTLMVSEPGYEIVGSKDLTCEDWMVNTRTDADLSAAVQNALQTLLLQIPAEIREEFRTSSGPSDAGGNPPLTTIHTWLKRFNKPKPHSFEKATALFDDKIRAINALPLDMCEFDLILGFLATIHDQPIVSEFPDVFLDELPGIPSVRKVEFNIELIPGSEPISKAPYRMASIEL